MVVVVIGYGLYLAGIDTRTSSYNNWRNASIAVDNQDDVLTRFSNRAKEKGKQALGNHARVPYWYKRANGLETPAKSANVGGPVGSYPAVLVPMAGGPESIGRS